jgi:cytochrome c-type biogenesis protein CcmH
VSPMRPKPPHSDQCGRVQAAVLTMALVLSPVALAQQPAPAFTAETESAAREVGKSLRCVVCQNQSIEESNAPLAADMRRLVRERIAAGDSKDAVMAYMTDRYGNFVRLQPPLQADTLLLWFGPLLFLLVAAAGWFAYLRPAAKRELAPMPLTEDEAAELTRRLESGGRA